MTAVKPGLAAVDLAARCVCRCPRSEHRLIRVGVYGGCRAHGKCAMYQLDETAAVAAVPVDDTAVCACGSPRGQHYADNGRLRGPRGCQDWHAACTSLCAHVPPVTRRVTSGSTAPVVLADRSGPPPARHIHPEAELPARLVEEPLPAPAVEVEAVEVEADEVVEVIEVVESLPPAPPAVSPPSAAVLDLLDVRCVCTHRRSWHGNARRAVPCREAHCDCRAFTPPTATVEPEVPDASVAPPPEPAPTPEPAPAPAVASAAALVEVGEQAEPLKRPRRSMVRPDTATRTGVVPVVGVPDVGEVAGAPEGATEGASVDRPEATRQAVASALHFYPAWFCARCLQRRLEPGRCPSCRGALVPVHVLIIPRSLA